MKIILTVFGLIVFFVGSSLLVLFRLVNMTPPHYKGAVSNLWLMGASLVVLGIAYQVQRKERVSKK